MKTHRLLLSAATACALLAACDNRLPEPDLPQTDDERVPLELKVKASPATETKGLIYGTSMPEGAILGVAVVEPDLMTYDGESLMNVPYVASTKDGAQVWNPVSDPILLSATTGNGHAYYPYSEDITSLKEIPMRASSDHQVDYMYAKKVNTLRKNYPSASMTMYHAMCGVRLCIKRGTYTGEGVITAASVKGDALATSCMFDAISVTRTEIQGAGEAIAPPIEPITITSEVQNIDIIAVPTGFESVIDIELCIDGRTISLQTPRKSYYSQGYLGLINITVDSGGSYVTSTDVTEWIHDSISNRIESKEHTITFAGVTDGLTFDSSVDEEGNITVIVAPSITMETEVKPVTIDGEATLEQSVNEETGIMTIKLSDINSDVTINFNGFWLWLTITFDVQEKQVGVEQKIFGTYTRPERVKMDGVDIDTDNMYTFETTGEHIMKIAVANYKVVPNSAFSYITGLKSAIFPEGVEKLEPWVFLGTSSFQEVSLPSTLKSIGYQAFERTGLISCVVPDGCAMSYGVFDECYYITYVKLPSDMKMIPSGTFQDCKLLEHIDLPDHFTDIDERAFSGSAIKSFVIPEEMTTIRYGTFSSCKQLEEVTLPPNLTKIETRAFMYCYELKRVIHADGSYNEGEFFIPEGVTDLGEYAIYMNSPYMHTVRLPSTLQNVVEKSFVSPMLERFTMNKSNPKYEVRNNSVVETATNTLVGGATQSTKIHDSVTTIGPYAFYDSKIEYIDIPASVTEIQDYAFAFSYPKQIISRALIPATLGTNPFQIAQYNGTLKVPAEAMDAYKSAWMINKVGYLGWSTARWRLQALAEGE